MNNLLDKKLESKRKERDGNFEHHWECCKHFWKIIWIHPITYALIFPLFCFGTYYDWDLKIMISVSFKHILTALITGMVQYLILEKRNK